MHNTNQIHSVSTPGKANTGSIRETFFASMLHPQHRVTIPKRGDFLVDENYAFEIGGRKKDYTQIRDIPHSWLAIDNITAGVAHKIPLWLFGFLY